MFKMEARVGGYGTEIKTGEYTFARGTESDVILQKLTAGAAVPTVEITIPEGLSLEETAQEVADRAASPPRSSRKLRRERTTDMASWRTRR